MGSKPMYNMPINDASVANISGFVSLVIFNDESKSLTAAITDRVIYPIYRVVFDDEVGPSSCSGSTYLIRRYID